METRRIRDGRYSLHRLLGEGSQGSTFEAVDLREGRPVAIKRLDIRGARNWKDVELAEREARVLATLDHPLVPRYIEHFEEDGALYLVMERIEGETLENMQRRGIFDESEARRFLTSAASALRYLHARSPAVIHRDIKPRNVIRRPDGTFVFVDFGAVSERLRSRGGSTAVGTIGFMAPEQLQGRVGPKADVYAVAATTIAAIAGSDPDTLPHRGLAIDVAAAIGTRVSASLVQALQQMVEPDPDQRRSTVAVVEGASREITRTAPLVSVIARKPGKADKPTPTPEDSQVRSIRTLLWVLWGLGWPAVAPVAQSPMPMFIWLAIVLVVTWHDNAILRMLLRKAGWSRGELQGHGGHAQISNAHIRVESSDEEMASSRARPDVERAQFLERGVARLP